MCSESVVAWFSEKFGGEMFVGKPPSLNCRARFTWQVRGRKVGEILPCLLPYLKEKKQRAILAIELANLISQSKPGRKRKVSNEEMSRRMEIASTIKDFNQNLRSEDVVQ
jgi:hypothetical protein